MKFHCVGEREFCEFYSFISAGCSICRESGRAAGIILSRSDDEIILISSILLKGRERELDDLIRDGKRRIIPLPSPEEKSRENEIPILRSLIGGA